MMIYIINQHKGDFNELLNHLDNFIQRCKSDKFKMVLRMDDAFTEDEYKFIESKIKSGNIVLDTHLKNENVGLSKSRFICANALSREYLPEDRIIFGCTNCLWNTDLTDELADQILSYKGVLFFDCNYEKDIYPKRTPYNKIIDFDNYVNDEYKPDYTISIPARFYRFIKYFDGEFYYPEEIIISKVLNELHAEGVLSVNTDPNIRNPIDIFPIKLQDCWYNLKGLSATFNRKSMTRNSKGYFERAVELLNRWCDPTEVRHLQLKECKLKALVYDLVTFGTAKQVIKSFEGTTVMGLYWWALQKWITNKNYNHDITFIEDEEKY